MKRKWIGMPQDEQEWDDYYDYFPILVSIVFGICIAAEVCIYIYLAVQFGIVLWKIEECDGRTMQVIAVLGGFAALPYVGCLIYIPVHVIMLLIFNIISMPIRLICAYIEQHEWWAHKYDNRWI